MNANDTKNTLADKTETLIATINDPVKGKALAARLIRLLTSPGWGYQHGSISNLGNAIVASSLIDDAVESKAPLNDNSVESLLALDQLLHTGPKDLMSVDVYSGVNVSIRIKDGEYENGKLYVFSREFNNLVDRICPVGNSGRPRWTEASHIRFEKDGHSIFVPREIIRGLDPTPSETITVKEAFERLNVKGGRELLERVEEVRKADDKDHQQRLAAHPNLQIEEIAKKLTATHESWSDAELSVISDGGTVPLFFNEIGHDKYGLVRVVSKDKIELKVYHEELRNMLTVATESGGEENLSMLRDYLGNVISGCAVDTRYQPTDFDVNAYYVFDKENCNSEPDGFAMKFVMSQPGIELLPLNPLENAYNRCIETLFAVTKSLRTLTYASKAQV